MGAALGAGGAYFAAVFALGFALGTLRVLALAPRLGETAAVAVELPAMLAASWFVCGRLLDRFRVRRARRDRAVMGAAAFLLLMLAEAAVAILLLGRGPAEHLAAYAAPAALLGLAGQIAFATIPLLRMDRGAVH